jgi:hypothetical protein
MIRSSLAARGLLLVLVAHDIPCNSLNTNQTFSYSRQESVRRRKADGDGAVKHAKFARVGVLPARVVASSRERTRTTCTPIALSAEVVQNSCELNTECEVLADRSSSFELGLRKTFGSSLADSAAPRCSSPLSSQVALGSRSQWRGTCRRFSFAPQIAFDNTSIAFILQEPTMNIRRSIARLAICSATMLGGMVVANAGVAHADSLLLQNFSQRDVTFAFADVDGQCQNGMRNHGWFPLAPSSGRAISLDLRGLVFAAAYTFDWTAGLFAVMPRSHRAQDLQWSMPLDRDTDGQCSEIVRVDPGEQPVNPSALWLAQWSRGIRCVPSIHGGDLNLVVRAFDVPEDPRMVMFEFFCIGGDSSPSPNPPADDPSIMQ